MRARPLTAAVLALSGLSDLAGGLWAALDWRGAAAFMARAVPNWRVQRRAISMAFADDALRQLWVNLGTALVALGVVQLLAAAWVRAGREEGDTLARLTAYALVAAAGLLAVQADQASALWTEGARGAVLLALVTWTRTAEARGRPGPGRDL